MMTMMYQNVLQTDYLSGNLGALKAHFIRFLNVDSWTDDDISPQAEVSRYFIWQRQHRPKLLPKNTSDHNLNIILIVSTIMMMMMNKEDENNFWHR